MENTKPNNPSVYPDPARGAEQSYSNQSPMDLETGMTLRDYFANSAMQGLLSARMFAPSDLEVYAEMSYSIADAMLKQRELNQ